MLVVKPGRPVNGFLHHSRHGRVPHSLGVEGYVAMCSFEVSSDNLESADDVWLSLWPKGCGGAVHYTSVGLHIWW